MSQHSGSVRARTRIAVVLVFLTIFCVAITAPVLAGGTDAENLVLAPLFVFCAIGVSALVLRNKGGSVSAPALDKHWDCVDEIDIVHLDPERDDSAVAA